MQSVEGCGCDFFGCYHVTQARLADALEEALAFWGDAGINGVHYAEYERLLAVLKAHDNA
jgi:hypothetical protein